MTVPIHARLRDPRYFQIASLASLAIYGLFVLRFDVSGLQCFVTLSATLAFQAYASWAWRLPTFDPKSALISGLSLCLLLRTDHLGLVLLAAAITIFGKFLIRTRHKHIFNPTNLALVALMALDGDVWVSTGQWGQAALLIFFLAGLGSLVVHRAARSDVTWAFMFFHVALRFGRAWWLGDPWSIPLHQLSQGALLIFAFFMISDPKSTPDSRAGRILFAFLVALGGYGVQFVLFRPHGLLWSLAVCALFVPVIDRLLPGERYRWARSKSCVRPTVHSPVLIAKEMV